MSLNCSILLVNDLSGIIWISSFRTPLPSSLTWILARPWFSSRTSMLLAPASTAFSISSLKRQHCCQYWTWVAMHSTSTYLTAALTDVMTCPELMRETVCWDNCRITQPLLSIDVILFSFTKYHHKGTRKEPTNYKMKEWPRQWLKIWRLAKPSEENPNLPSRQKNVKTIKMHRRNCTKSKRVATFGDRFSISHLQ